MPAFVPAERIESKTRSCWPSYNMAFSGSFKSDRWETKSPKYSYCTYGQSFFSLVMPLNVLPNSSTAP